MSYNKQWLCSYYLLRGLGLYPQPLKINPPYDVLDGYYINSKGATVFFKTTVRRDPVDKYQSHFIESTYLEPLAKRWKDGNEVCYFNFFHAGKTRVYNCIAYNIGERLKEGMTYVEREYPQRTIGGNGIIVRKKVVELTYDEKYLDQKLHIEIPKTPRK